MSASRTVTLTPNIDDGDSFYDELLGVHEGLDDAASHALNARLVLILCNHIGDRQVIREALAVARGTDATGTNSTNTAASPAAGRDQSAEQDNAGSSA